MTKGQPSGVVVDTMVISWLFDDRPNRLAEHYHMLIGPRPVLLAFQTVMELRYGVLRAGWGQLRRRRLERRIGGPSPEAWCMSSLDRVTLRGAV